jgi:hypothetical protein
MGALLVTTWFFMGHLLLFMGYFVPSYNPPGCKTGCKNLKIMVRLFFKPVFRIFAPSGAKKSRFLAFSPTFWQAFQWPA